ncbi:hypothetical protein TWF730_006448 [Orbilia blumenaviensis]|uniref:Titin n=1 Tax=Orbilia blumenaviensis TaxID=1796055 RepID=A0AAV9VE97_9PEZI
MASNNVQQLIIARAEGGSRPKTRRIADDVILMHLPPGYEMTNKLKISSSVLPAHGELSVLYIDDPKHANELIELVNLRSASPLVNSIPPPRRNKPLPPHNEHPENIKFIGDLLDEDDEAHASHYRHVVSRIHEVMATGILKYVNSEHPDDKANIIPYLQYLGRASPVWEDRAKKLLIEEQRVLQQIIKEIRGGWQFLYYFLSSNKITAANWDRLVITSMAQTVGKSPILRDYHAIAYDVSIDNFVHGKVGETLLTQLDAWKCAPDAINPDSFRIDSPYMTSRKHPMQRLDELGEKFFRKLTNTHQSGEILYTRAVLCRSILITYFFQNFVSVWDDCILNGHIQGLKGIVPSYPKIVDRLREYMSHGSCPRENHPDFRNATKRFVHGENDIHPAPSKSAQILVVKASTLGEFTMVESRPLSEDSSGAIIKQGMESSTKASISKMEEKKRNRRDRRKQMRRATIGSVEERPAPGEPTTEAVIGILEPFSSEILVDTERQDFASGSSNRADDSLVIEPPKTVPFVNPQTRSLIEDLGIKGLDISKNTDSVTGGSGGVMEVAVDEKAPLPGPSVAGQNYSRNRAKKERRKARAANLIALQEIEQASLGAKKDVAVSPPTNNDALVVPKTKKSKKRKNSHPKAENLGLIQRAEEEKPTETDIFSNSPEKQIQPVPQEQVESKMPRRRRGNSQMPTAPGAAVAQTNEPVKMSPTKPDVDLYDDPEAIAAGIKASEEDESSWTKVGGKKHETSKAAKFMEKKGPRMPISHGHNAVFPTRDAPSRHAPPAHKPNPKPPAAQNKTAPTQGQAKPAPTQGKPKVDTPHGQAKAAPQAQVKAGPTQVQAKSSPAKAQVKAGPAQVQAKASPAKAQVSSGTTQSQVKSGNAQVQAKAGPAQGQAKIAAPQRQVKATPPQGQAKFTPAQVQVKIIPAQAQVKTAPPQAHIKSTPQIQIKAATPQGQVRAAPIQGQAKTTPQGQVKAVTHQSQVKVAISQSQVKVAPVQGQAKAASVQGQAKAAPVQGQAKAAHVKGQTKAAPVKGQAKVTPVQGQAKVAPVQGQCKIVPAKALIKVAPAQNEIKSVQSKANTTRSQSPPRQDTVKAAALVQMPSTKENEKPAGKAPRQKREARLPEFSSMEEFPILGTSTKPLIRQKDTRTTGEPSPDMTVELASEDESSAPPETVAVSTASEIKIGDQDSSKPKSQSVSVISPSRPAGQTKTEKNESRAVAESAKSKKDIPSVSKAATEATPEPPVIRSQSQSPQVKAPITEPTTPPVMPCETSNKEITIMAKDPVPTRALTKKERRALAKKAAEEKKTPKMSVKERAELRRSLESKKSPESSKETKDESSVIVDSQEEIPSVQSPSTEHLGKRVQSPGIKHPGEQVQSPSIEHLGTQSQSPAIVHAGNPADSTETPTPADEGISTVTTRSPGIVHPGTPSLLSTSPGIVHPGISEEPSLIVSPEPSIVQVTKDVGTATSEVGGPTMDSSNNLDPDGDLDPDIIELPRYPPLGEVPLLSGVRNGQKFKVVAGHDAARLLRGKYITIPKIPKDQKSGAKSPEGPHPRVEEIVDDEIDRPATVPIYVDSRHRLPSSVGRAG